MVSPNTAGNMPDLSPEAELLAAAFQTLPIAVLTADVRTPMRNPLSLLLGDTRMFGADSHANELTATGH